MKKKPRFFCDHCGQEVSRDVKSCPNCGRYFASVRCPSCTYSGPDEMFQGGCPMCGYSAPPPPKTPERKFPKVKKKYNNSDPLPTWTYIVTIVILLAVIAFFSHFITR